MRLATSTRGRLVCVWLLALLCTAVEARVFNGTLLCENGDCPRGAYVRVNGAEQRLDGAEFQLRFDAARVYRVQFGAPGHYTSLRVFSEHELAAAGAAATDVGAVSLVQRKTGRVLLAFAGDVMMGRRYLSGHNGAAPLIAAADDRAGHRRVLAEVREFLQMADWTSVNLESQIIAGAPSSSAGKSVSYHSAPMTLDALHWAGVDHVNLGNNHTYDYLQAGLSETLTHLRDSPLAYSGAGVDLAQALKPSEVSLESVPLAFLGFVGWPGHFTPNQVAGVDKGGAALGTRAQLMASVAALPHDTVSVVQYHGSLEYQARPSALTEDRVKAAIDAGADLVVVHHPHVIQGLELYRGRLIDYSLGNFVFDQNYPQTVHTHLLYVWLDGAALHRAELVPVHIQGYVPTPATGAHRMHVLRQLSALSAERGVHLQPSAGHLVLDPQRSLQHEHTLMIQPPAAQRDLALPLWPAAPLSALNLQGQGRHRLGVNQWIGGDFEHLGLFAATDQAWHWRGGDLSHEVTHSGFNALQLAPTAKAPALIEMPDFRRVFTPATPMTLSAQLLSPQALTARALIQLRGARQSLNEALANDWVPLAEATLPVSDDWQALHLDFYLPRVRYREYRLRLQLSHATPDASGAPVQVDDVALIEWQAHFNDGSDTAGHRAALPWASHIGFVRASEAAQTLESARDTGHATGAIDGQ